MGEIGLASAEIPIEDMTVVTTIGTIESGDTTGTEIEIEIGINGDTMVETAKDITIAIEIGAIQIVIGKGDATEEDNL